MIKITDFTILQDEVLKLRQDKKILIKALSDLIKCRQQGATLQWETRLLNKAKEALKLATT